VKYLEDLRDLHEGEEIWVIGAGPSLDAFPLDFFIDKICIGVNWVFSVFLNIGDGIEKFKYDIFYSVHSHRPEADWIAKHLPGFLPNCFLILSPHRKGIGYDYRKYCCKEFFNDDPYWIRNAWQKGNTTASDKTFRAMAKCIMARKDNCRYYCRGTTVHWAIDVAVVLGAKKIYVVGAGAKGSHMRKHGSKYVTDKRIYNSPQWRSGTRALARALKPYGVEVSYYNYIKGELKL